MATDLPCWGSRLLFYFSIRQKKTIPDKMANTTAKEIDCACEDGIPGSDLRLATGRSWFSVFFSIMDSTLLITEPPAAQSASASCLQRTMTPRTAATSHLLYIKGRAVQIIKAGFSPQNLKESSILCTDILKIGGWNFDQITNRRINLFNKILTYYRLKQ